LREKNKEALSVEVTIEKKGFKALLVYKQKFFAGTSQVTLFETVNSDELVVGVNNFLAVHQMSIVFFNAQKIGEKDRTFGTLVYTDQICGCGNGCHCQID